METTALSVLPPALRALPSPPEFSALLSAACGPQCSSLPHLLFVCLAAFVAFAFRFANSWQVVVVTGRGPYAGQGPHLQVPQFIPRAPASPQMMPQRQHGGGLAAIYPSQFGSVPSPCRHLYISSLPKFYPQIAQILRLVLNLACSACFFQPEQYFSFTTIQPEQCFSASFGQNSASRTRPIIWIGSTM